MSKFHTNIPVDVEASFAKLPIGSRVVNYTLDQAKRELVVEWEHDQLTTPYNVPIPFALDDLQAGKVPNMAKDERVTEVTKVEEKQESQPIVTPSTITLTETLDKAPEKRNKSRK